jgi:hypothetical protein
LRTGDLPYWLLDTPHAVALAGMEPDQAYLFDPAWDAAPVTVALADWLPAWSHTEYSYAVLRPAM